MNVFIYKEIVRLKTSKLKIVGALTQKKLVFVEEYKQFLAVMECKGFQGFVTPVESENIELGISDPGETYKVTSCPLEMNGRACQLTPCSKSY